MAKPNFRGKPRATKPGNLFSAFKFLFRLDIKCRQKWGSGGEDFMQEKMSIENTDSNPEFRTVKREGGGGRGEEENH